MLSELLVNNLYTKYWSCLIMGLVGKGFDELKMVHIVMLIKHGFLAMHTHNYIHTWI